MVYFDLPVKLGSKTSTGVRIKDDLRALFDYGDAIPPVDGDPILGRVWETSRREEQMSRYTSFGENISGENQRMRTPIARKCLVVRPVLSDGGNTDKHFFVNSCCATPQIATLC